MPSASNGAGEPKLITFTTAQGIPRTYRETEVDKMFVDYLRNIERLPEADLTADFTQKDHNSPIASLKKISDLWSKTKKAAAEATAR